MQLWPDGLISRVCTWPSMVARRRLVRFETGVTPYWPEAAGSAGAAVVAVLACRPAFSIRAVTSKGMTAFDAPVGAVD